MYPVSANFHTLAIQDAPKTRVRVYFIGDAVDCTDDNAVQTNGTLLIGKAGDTDSNGRIGQNGITFNEFFNSDKNIQVGAAVSSQIGMTLLNTDGALDNFQYGRCKVYLDVYDAANSSWLTCPMGVYIIDLPTKRKAQLVNATGYDQMQKLDEICDTWWSALNWSGGITLSQLLTSLATKIGVSVSSNTASAIVNGSVSFTEEPFQCIEVTYREVLEYIAEATGTVARFDRNGALDLRWFAAAQISGNNVTVNTDTVGNQCLAISVAEYSVAAVDLLKVKLYTDDIGTTVGTGTNQYTIVNNLFLDGANSSAIIAKATPIYNRLHGLGAYSPVSARIIMDWSIEAGDIINIVNGGTAYSVPIFQQSMAWRGGYVVSDLLSDGDNVRPVLDYDERTYYRLNSEMSKKVGDNEIISKINQSPEQITIQANKLSLLGYTTINDGFKVNLDGTFEAKGATIDGTINVGKNNNSAGLIKIYDSTGTQTGQIDNQGVRVWEELLGGETYTGVLTSGALHIIYNQAGVDITSVAIGVEGIGGGFVGVSDSNDVQRLTMSAPDGLIPRFEASASSGYQSSRMTENGFKTYYPDVVGHRAIVLENNPTHSYLYLYSPDGTTDIVLDTNSGVGSSFNTKVAANAGLSVTGDLTVNGTLDVTPRRCYAALSSAGWYRVFNVTGGLGRAGSSFTITLHIGRAYNNTDNELHTVTLLANYSNQEFSSEVSKSNTLGITKVRYTEDGSNNGHIDIYYNLTAENFVYVNFDVHCRPENAYLIRYNAVTPTAVVPSPSGETVLTEYTFADNTTTNETVPKNSSFGASLFTCYARRRNGLGIVYMNIAVPATSSWTETTMCTLTTFKPSTNMSFTVNGQGGSTFLLSFYTSGNVTIWAPSATAAQFLRGSFVLFVD